MHQDLLQLQTCQTFSMTKTEIPRSWHSKVTLIDASGHIDQKLLISQEYFWAIFFLRIEMIRATSNQKPTLSKQSSHEKRCFKLEGRPRNATLPKVDNPQKKRKNEWIKEKEKLIVISCTWKFWLSPNKNQESQILKF